MRRLTTFYIALAAIIFVVNSPARAQIGQIPNIAQLMPAPSVTCSQATTLLARYTAAGGSLSGTESNAMTTMVCGLVTDGVITGNMNGAGPAGSSACGAPLDALYVYAVNNSTNALLNLCSTSFAGHLVTSSVAASFSADQGFTGTSTGVIGTNYTPSTAAANMVQDSVSIGYCNLTPNTANVGRISMGVGVTTELQVEALDSAQVFYSANDGTQTLGGVVFSTTQGFFAVSRAAGSGSRQVYGPSGSSSAAATASVASTALPTGNLCSRT